jgi:phosphoglycerol transferase MdoB-like AlkP superfamily enzyme
MLNSTRNILSHRFGLLALMTGLLVFISCSIRTVLLIKSAGAIDFTVSNIMAIYLLGLFYDLVNASYFIIPFVLYLWLVPDRIFLKPYQRWLTYGVFYFFVAMLLFDAVSEWYFWEEFNTRFNFIAVDYLVYTNEVIGNIRQSYPIGWILVFIAFLSFLIVLSLQRWINLASIHSIRFKRRSRFAVVLLVLPVFFFFTVNNKLHKFSTNAYVNELSGNGLYELFAAYLNNELDYEQFYARLDSEKAFALIRNALTTPDSEFTNTTPFSIERNIHPPGEEKKLNVVLISIESFSADFMGIFGNQAGITPFLDSLAGESLLFTQVYSTGTRTVRGLEALSLCIPPTPGQSIVRRPNNENLFSLGSVFDAKGYESKYIYGGYGYFDNMNYFFSHNGYEVYDRNKIPEYEIAYENIWGVADENLFTLALKEIDNSYHKGKPLFAHIMTTSNHRPFTYPDGRIDIPSHTNREGAVKYTDYAIRKFIEACTTKPWFNQTLFVITADHCASSAGKSELPVNKYHIPMLWYSPHNISPGKMERLMSQIDIGPSLLGFLNFNYRSNFFGFDIFKLEPGRERAFISTYQSLGYIKNNKLIVLGPQKSVHTYFSDFATGAVTQTEDDPALIQEAIAWYQSASYEFSHGLLKYADQ